jgi:hypothetical protein
VQLRRGGAGGARTHDRRIMRRPDNTAFGFYLRLWLQPIPPDLLGESGVDHSSHHV